MSTITEQWHEQAEVREFSLKEVCDILSTLMCFNDTHGCDEDGVYHNLESQIHNAMCVEHKPEKVNQLIEHIEMIGIQDVVLTLSQYCG